jgi:hypothetical protein
MEEEHDGKWLAFHLALLSPICVAGQLLPMGELSSLSPLHVVNII